MNAVKTVFLAMIAGGVLAGCAASRSEVDVAIAKPSTTPTKAAVKITEVVDKRQFEISPRSPSTPSVRDNEIQNKELTARAVGRKRGGFGNAWGDVVLPEGQTVSGLVEQVLAAALAAKGYAVVPKGGVGYETARPLSAEIEKFWSWVNLGMDIRITHESLIRLTGPWPVPESGREVRGHAFYNSYVAIVESDWGDLLKAGTSDLQRNAAAVLQ
jgi:hypothetical protein